MGTWPMHRLSGRSAASVCAASLKAATMKHKAIFVVAALAFSFARPGEAAVVAAPAPEVVAEEAQPKTNREVVAELVDRYAAEYGVDAGSMLRTLSNENDTFDFCRQSGLTYKAGNRWGKPAGSREESFGVAQIHLPDNPSVTKEQACDPDFSVRFMAQKFSEGRHGMWMGYRG